jgi:hypothetical protein
LTWGFTVPIEIIGNAGGSASTVVVVDRTAGFTTPLIATTATAAATASTSAAAAPTFTAFARLIGFATRAVGAITRVSQDVVCPATGGRRFTT